MTSMMVGRLRLLGMTYFVPVLAACTTTASAPVANQSSVGPSLCSVLATVAESAVANFITIDPEHDRRSGAFETTVVPPGAKEAFMMPCCASDSAEFGPWTWSARFTATPLDTLRTRLTSCPIVPRLVEKRTARVIEWRGTDLAIRLTETRPGEVELSVARE